MKTLASFALVGLAAVAAVLGASCTSGSSAQPTSAVDRLDQDERDPMSSTSTPATGTGASVKLPELASGRVVLRDRQSSLSVAFVLDGAANVAAEQRDGVVVYPRALDGADVMQRLTAEGMEDYVAFRARPSREEITYSFSTKNLAGLRLVSNTLEMLDSLGAPRLRVSPPFLIDAAGAKIPATLAVEGCAVDTDPSAPWGREVVAPGSSACTLHVHWSDVRYPAVLDPAWSSAGSFSVALSQPLVNLLPSGKVLIVEENDNTAAHLYDPATRTVAVTGSTTAARLRSVSSVLKSGKVLVAGGFRSPRTGEIYDPATGVFTATSGVMFDDRDGASAATLANGKVLVSGGSQKMTADLYDPATNTFTATGSMSQQRYQHFSLLLGNGKILVATGGNGGTALPAELYDPATGAFTSSGTPSDSRTNTQGVLLRDGTVLVPAGYTGGNTVGAQNDVYDPATGVFTPVAPLAAARAYAGTALLDDGRALVAGGSKAPTITEIYDPVKKTFSLGPPLKFEHGYLTLVPLSGGRILAIGASAQIEIFKDFAKGAACATSDDCDSSLCVDGVCCDSACNGQCEACDVAGHLGTCTAVTGAAHGIQKTCAGKDPACGGKCDGKNRTACSFAQSSTTCGAACSSAAFATSACNGKGACVVSAAHACEGNYACANDTKCAVTCADNKDCATGYACKDAKCIQTAKCIGDETSEAIDGKRAACSPYKCDADGDGTCRISCRSVDDCVGGAICTPDGTCSLGSDDSASGCSTTSSSSAGAPAWLLALVAAGVATRLRTRRRAAGPT